MGKLPKLPFNSIIECIVCDMYAEKKVDTRAVKNTKQFDGNYASILTPNDTFQGSPLTPSPPLIA